MLLGLEQGVLPAAQAAPPEEREEALREEGLLERVPLLLRQEVLQQARQEEPLRLVE